MPVLVVEDQSRQDGGDEQPHRQEDGQKEVGHFRLEVGPNLGQNHEQLQHNQKAGADIQPLFMAELIEFSRDIVEHQEISLFRKAISPTTVEPASQAKPKIQA